MLATRINIEALTLDQFPQQPAGCTKEEVIASWVKAGELLEKEKRSKGDVVSAYRAREICWKILCDQDMDDIEAMYQIDRVLRYYGLA
jgi:hypothetical protein